MPAVTSVTASAALFVLAALGLQGCGQQPTPAPTPAPTPGPPTNTTTRTTTTVPEPGPTPEIGPLKGLHYNPVPCAIADTEPGGKCRRKHPALDYVQRGYENQWGKARNDLKTIKELGASAVHIEDAFGLESKNDHSGFLNYAEYVELQVFPGFYTQMMCPDFDCFDSWHKAALNGFERGFKKGDGWHPAVAMVVLMNEPDNLNLGGVSPVNCQGTDEARCRVRAALSALDGVLQAEKDVGMNLETGSVGFTIAWSENIKTSIDGVVSEGYGYFGFQDMVAGIANPSLASYTPRSSLGELAMAFEKRWTHAMNTVRPWEYVQGQVEPTYESLFGSKPWILTGFKGQGMSAKEFKKNLQQIGDASASKGPFLGAILRSFQNETMRAEPERTGVFALGNHTMGVTDSVCQEDPSTQASECNRWSVYCLERENTERKSAIIEMWKGNDSWVGGICTTTTTTTKTTTTKTTTTRTTTTQTTTLTTTTIITTSTGGARSMVNKSRVVV